MGGPVSIVVRDTEGKVHAFDAWTGFISDFFDSVEFLDEDPDFVNLVYRELKRFWEDQDGTENALVAPDCYGLVVGDMKEKVILSSQGYHYPGKVIGASVAMSMENRIIGEPPGRSQEEITRKLIESGRIKEISTYRDETTNVEGMTLEEIMETGADEHGVHPFFLVIDTAPYTIEMFSEGVDGLREMHARIKELGFELSDADEEGWKTFIEQIEE